MKTRIDCIDAYEVEFTKDGEVFKEDQVRELEQTLAAGGVTDLVAISHGWNNDSDDARALYGRFFAEWCRQRANAPASPRRYVALTVLWPSKKFADRDLIPGGGASAAGLADEALDRSLDVLTELLPEAGDLAQARRLFDRLEDDEAAQRAFVDLLRSKLRRNPETEREDGLQHMFNQPGDEILRRLQRPIASRVQRPAGDADTVTAAHVTDADDRDAATTRGAGLGDTLQGTKGAALRFANLTTYYAMKERAGLVGTRGLDPVLQRLVARAPGVNVHLVGHSFGGRLIAAAAAATPLANLRSLTLLQAAFSHFGFAREWEPNHPGGFRSVIAERRVNGPVIITQSIHDIPVGVAYAAASRLAGTIGSAIAEAPALAAGIMDRVSSAAAAGLRMIIGGPNDPYGGIGRNGALGLVGEEGVTVRPIHAAGAPYDFAAGRVYNLIADDCVMEHSDICGSQVVYAAVQAMTRA
jgi:pimeloyl-ACP methyl ester carboxylesterase